MKMKSSIIIGLLLSVSSMSFAQSDADEIPLKYGIRAGASYSSIADLETTILSEPYFINYTLKTEPRYGWSTGIFLNYRLRNQVVALESEIMYAQQGSDLKFKNV